MVRGHIVPNCSNFSMATNNTVTPRSYPSHSPGDDLGLSGSIIIFPL